jgi:hypothetical protein
MSVSTMLERVGRATLAAAVFAALTSGSVAFADPQPTTRPTPVPDAAHWTAYGFDVIAPASMWPMLVLLHTLHFDWELTSAAQRPTPLVWSDLPTGVFGQYDRSINVVRLSNVLLSSGVEARTAFLAHELTHLNDDLNGRLADGSSAGCYAAEVRAFENEANFWIMVFGPQGKQLPDPIEARENTRMWAFVGNPHFVDLVLQTTPSYIRQCGFEQ